MTTRLLLCEKTGRWAIGWKRAIPQAHWRGIKQLRSLIQCEQALGGNPRQLVAVEVTAENAEFVLAALAAWRSRWPACRTIALLSPRLEPWTPWLLDAGALAVATSTRELPSLARLVHRFSAQNPPVEPSLTIRETIWSRLPWPGFASQAVPKTSLQR
jgi:hypothetical protein